MRLTDTEQATIKQWLANPATRDFAERLCLIINRLDIGAAIADLAAEELFEETRERA